MQSSGCVLYAFGALGDDHLTLLLLSEHVDVVRVSVPASVECEVVGDRVVHAVVSGKRGNGWWQGGGSPCATRGLGRAAAQCRRRRPGGVFAEIESESVNAVE